MYSGSFDPLHIGHQAIMEYLTKDRKFDWVYLVISPQSPFKHADKALNALQRYRDAIEAVKRHPELHVWVDDIELTMDPPQYTIKTLDALKRREPENDFTLVMGADNLYWIRGWRDFRRVLTEYGVAVYPRKGFDTHQIRTTLIEECRRYPTPYVLDSSEAVPDGMASLEENLLRYYNIEVLDAPIVDISSTEIREAQERGENMDKWLM